MPGSLINDDHYMFASVQSSIDFVYYFIWVINFCCLTVDNPTDAGWIVLAHHSKDDSIDLGSIYIRLFS